MNIPRYWTKATGETTGPDGSALKLTAWGWSSTDIADALKNAEDRLSRIMARAESGDAHPDKYPYGVRALREEIIEHIPRGDDAAAAAIVTRNAYGSLVLNTPDVMFVDVDVPQPTVKSLLGGLFSRKSSNADEGWQKIASALESATSSSFRIYATAGGYRLIATERTFSPGSSEAERIMEAVGADQSYVQLCRAQKSFRARLTPKPWRADLGAPPNQFPRDPREQAAFDQWLTKYDQKCAEKAVCKFLGESGGSRVAASVGAVLRYHDEHTRVKEDLPLA